MREPEEAIDPLDLVMDLAKAENRYCRRDDDSVTVYVEGLWSHYSLTLMHNNQTGILRLVGFCQLRVPERQLPKMYELLNLVNSAVDYGRFAYLKQAEGIVFIDHADSIDEEGLEFDAQEVDLMQTDAVSILDVYYHTFQLVLVKGVSIAVAYANLDVKTYGRD